MDFEEDRIHIVAKDRRGDLFAWEPKDHEARMVPIPATVAQILADLQGQAIERRPYAFVPPKRWEFVQKARAKGTWRQGQRLLNNLNKRLATWRKRAGVSHFTFHDLRRTCITNWARKLPAHVTRRLAGHSDTKTTLRYYISVRLADLDEARQVQEDILSGEGTDPRVTHSGRNGRSLGQEQERPGT